MIVIKKVENEKEFNEAIKLRYQILRLPLNLPKGTETDELESSATTIIAIENESVVGTGRIHRGNEATMQIRYMAVLPEKQNRKVGEKILKALENFALENEASEITLNARDEIKNFYIKNGYFVVGKPFEAVGICHVRMNKRIS